MLALAATSGPVFLQVKKLPYHYSEYMHVMYPPEVWGTLLCCSVDLLSPTTTCLSQPEDYLNVKLATFGLCISVTGGIYLHSTQLTGRKDADR